MHSERQLLITQSFTRNEFGHEIVDEKHSMQQQQHDNKITRNKKVSFDPFTHAETMIQKQSDFTWNIFDNMLTRVLRSMASALNHLPQDPRAKKSSAIVFTTSDNNSNNKSHRATMVATTTKPKSIISSSNNNKRIMIPHKQQHRHQCWQPINSNNNSIPQQEKSALPSWMFTHRHVRDIRSNSDGLRKLAVKVEMVRHKKLKINQVKTEHKRYLPSRNDDFVPCKKSSLSQQLFNTHMTGEYFIKIKRLIGIWKTEHLRIKGMQEIATGIDMNHTAIKGKIITMEI
ncbi:hypothetical protein BDA99DRAFT_533031 [Phascolomyces articulosus]|uniref:Uncharacterized protein n=1 Tax=Phascolomyces articulosus TaxID=60185 RepID=A0AAD5K8B7_9FUNG|nr:hypothetical protein BDA99DRAFT_533031 [Phascolomyces articulosus]